MQQVCQYEISSIQQRNFTCETRGSEVLAWESSLIIGEGSRIQFASYEMIGTTKESEILPDVRANLIGNEMRNGVRVLLCSLTIPESITVQLKQYQIVCLNTGLDTQTITGVQVKG